MLIHRPLSGYMCVAMKRKQKAENPGHPDKRNSSFPNIL